jgi:hypothetical protein
MDESEAVDEQGAVATPIFSVYRRGYDPEQVDRYVADHQRRLDDAIHRSSEAERKLAAAVGQLRELHRRVAVYESEARNSQPPRTRGHDQRARRRERTPYRYRVRCTARAAGVHNASGAIELRAIARAHRAAPEQQA